MQGSVRIWSTSLTPPPLGVLTGSRQRPSLVHLKATVNVTDKRQRSPERDRPKHERENKRSEQRISEEFHALYKAAHVGAIVVVEERVNKYKDAGGSGAQDASPPPAVVFA